MCSLPKVERFLVFVIFIYASIPESVDSSNVSGAGGTYCSLATTVVEGKKAKCAGDLVIVDEFKGPSVDTSKWKVEHSIPTYAISPYEFNTYQNIDDTRFIRDDILYLKPIALQSDADVRGALNLKDGCTSSNLDECFVQSGGVFLLPPVKSAKISSKISFKYGKVEIKAKLPAGEWIFPIIQLEPKQKDHANSSKIWVAYSRGNDHLTGNDGVDIGSRLLFAGPAIHPKEPARSSRMVSRRNKAPYSDDYHVYALEWVPGKMTFLLDGEVYGSVDTKDGFASPPLTAEASFDEEYVLSLGVAVGGIEDFPNDVMSGSNAKPWINEARNSVRGFFNSRNEWLKSWNAENVALHIDYVKVWAV